MHLSDALLIWLNANTARMEGSNENEDDCTGILKQVHVKNVSVYSFVKYLIWVTLCLTCQVLFICEIFCLLQSLLNYLFLLLNRSVQPFCHCGLLQVCLIFECSRMNTDRYSFSLTCPLLHTLIGFFFQRKEVLVIFLSLLMRALIQFSDY